MKHSENSQIQDFMPLVANVLQKGLQALSDGQSTYSADPIEQYAYSVFSRVSEIDNAFKGIEITIEYLKKGCYSESDFSFAEHHAFHVENYLLRLTSVVDRAYLLAGSSLFMSDEKIEAWDGKKLITSKLKLESADSLKVLNKMNRQIDALKKTRNKVAHQAGYSNKNLCAVEFIENSESPEIYEELTRHLSLQELKEIIISDVLPNFESVAKLLHELVEELIGCLSFVYHDLLART
ncbi:Cthe_2314 family HEPN domain-containing protein [Pseudoalteromonas luteoviolacea]|uniref:Cthe-2314-like HEPN domain-containing protein n=1 Tax=Pseudoalteromonas luteoviolacea H33 TaxID=1365251 RepID=A0A167AVA3_9GAMM|nr:Cthe_2314 family HEPN domain-containing protein [Pseudoalteromonas luteoviolacea]KZN45842.1 hypothetical protein N476_25090 [Pseudoalteromonas luteoviolacea H33]KZN76961.1 hypothetical protein N477_13970 [Pseudoalteromonas luteoviolacea H33-S]